MLISRYPLIAREGWSILLGVFALGAALAHFFSLWLIVPFFFLWLFLAFLFRDPARKVPPLPLAIVSPVDGKVVFIGRESDPFLHRDSYRIELEMSPSGIFSVRSPIEGKLLQQWRGASTTQDVKYAQCLQTDEKDSVVWGVANGSLMNPRCYSQPGERLGQGQRCGYLMLGGRIVLFIPGNSRVRIELGELVRAGESVIADLVHQNVASIIDD